MADGKAKGGGIVHAKQHRPLPPVAPPARSCSVSEGDVKLAWQFARDCFRSFSILKLPFQIRRNAVFGGRHGPRQLFPAQGAAKRCGCRRLTLASGVGCSLCREYQRLDRVRSTQDRRQWTVDRGRRAAYRIRACMQVCAQHGPSHSKCHQPGAQAASTTTTSCSYGGSGSYNGSGSNSGSSNRL